MDERLLAHLPRSALHRDRRGQAGLRARLSAIWRAACDPDRKRRVVRDAGHPWLVLSQRVVDAPWHRAPAHSSGAAAGERRARAHAPPMHRTLKRRAIKPVQRSCASQQRHFYAFRHEYNPVRPHEALQLETPATRCWAALLQQIFEVDPLACPTCRGPMRIIAFITHASVIHQILAHHRSRAAHAAYAGARSGPTATFGGPGRHPPSHGDRRSHGAHGARARRRARCRPSRGAGESGNCAVSSTDSQPTLIGIPIPRRV